jgi:hypothetical protein
MNQAANRWLALMTVNIKRLQQKGSAVCLGQISRLWIEVIGKTEALKVLERKWGKSLAGSCHLGTALSVLLFSNNLSNLSVR